jgi:opacity protein-like surface antigen
MLVRFKTWLLALTCCLIASPVLAEGGWNSAVVFSAGYAKEQGACDSPLLAFAIPAGTCSERQPVYRFAYNYSFTPIWGLEVSYGNLAKAEEDGTMTAAWGGEQGSWKMKANGFAIAATGTIPMGGGLSLLGKIGGVRAEFDEDVEFNCGSTDPLICPDGPGPYHVNDSSRIRTAKNGLTYGLGLQYDFNKSYAIRAQYENFGKYNLIHPGDGSTLKINLSQISAGFVLRF